MADLSRDVLQELFDGRFPDGASIEIMAADPPFEVIHMETPRLVALADGVVLFSLPTIPRKMTVASLEESEESVTLVDEASGFSYRFMKPKDVQDGVALKEERISDWSDDRVQLEREWFTAWHAEEEA